MDPIPVANSESKQSCWSNIRWITSRNRYLFVFGIIVGGGLFFHTVNKITYVQYDYVHNIKFTAIKDAPFDPVYTIKTEGCIIPFMKPLSDDVKKFYGYPKNMQSCPFATRPFFGNNKTHIWVNKANLHYHNVTNLTEVQCCYKSFYRDNAVSNIYASNIDDRITYRNCINFRDIIEVKDEFVRATCYSQGKEVYDNFFIFAPLKDIVLFDDAVEMPRKKHSYNVIILGIDAVSRLNFHRTMPKTLAFIKAKDGIELLGYNKVGDNSYPNLVPLLMGYSHTELKHICHPHTHSTYDFCPFIWKLFKDAGYYTAFGEDSSFLGTFNYLLDGFFRTPTDYYAHPFIHQAEKYAGRIRDWNPYICMRDKFLYKVLLDYAEDIMITLQTHRLFGFFWEMTMSHDYLNYPIVMDESYETFLKRLDASKYLDESIIFLVSDHGMRWGSIRSTKQGRLEERLPFVYVLTPPTFRKEYSEAFKNLKMNSGRLTTPFDVHSALSDLADLNNIKNEHIIFRSKEFYAHDRAISLFLPIPTNRTCETAGIEDHWCTCHKDITISKESKEAKQAANHLIAHMNMLMLDYPQCVRLSLSEVLGATEMVAGQATRDEVWREYIVMVQTTPGDGLFEATLRSNSYDWQVSGTVSRLNLYGNQSHCVNLPLLKLYCYCK